MNDQDDDSLGAWLLLAAIIAIGLAAYVARHHAT